MEDGKFLVYSVSGGHWYKADEARGNVDRYCTTPEEVEAVVGQYGADWPSNSDLEWLASTEE